MPLVEAALEGARLRLRPILMTSFAFIFGCLPLWGAEGAGAAARRMLGTSVVTGMLAATLLGIFLVPALFVVTERLAGHRDPDGSREAEDGRERPASRAAHGSSDDVGARPLAPGQAHP
jgi:HAE1 family hydrophobic/amphiphilic exporter-1